MYFNNAATTWPKPEIVYQTTDDCFRSLNSPERTTSDEGTRNSARMSSCRGEVAEFFGIKDANRLIFTPSATYAMNLAILGLDWREGDVVVMSGLEHHAVSRPIRKVARENGVRFEVAPYTPDRPIDLDFVEDQLKKRNVKPDITALRWPMRPSGHCRERARFDSASVFPTPSKRSSRPSVFWRRFLGCEDS